MLSRPWGAVAGACLLAGAAAAWAQPQAPTPQADRAVAYQLSLPPGAAFIKSGHMTYRSPILMYKKLRPDAPAAAEVVVQSKTFSMRTRKMLSLTAPSGTLTPEQWSENLGGSIGFAYSLVEARNDDVIEVALCDPAALGEGSKCPDLGLLSPWLKVPRETGAAR